MSLLFALSLAAGAAEVTVCTQVGEDAELGEIVVDRLKASLEGAGHTVVAAEDDCTEEGTVDDYVFVTVACAEDACDWTAVVHRGDVTAENDGQQRPRNFALTKIDAFVSRNFDAPPPPAVSVPAPEPEPVPAPTPDPEPVAVAPVVAPAADPEPKEWARPSGLIGIGIGTVSGDGPIGLNAASVRIRATPGFVIEPVLGFTYTSSLASTVLDVVTVTVPATTTTTTTTTTTGTGTFTVPVTSSSTEVTALTPSLGALVRGRVAEGGPVDLSLLGSAEFSYAALSTTIRQGTIEVDSTTSNTVALGVAWGVGAECFATPNWSVSLDALNPVFTYAVTTIPEDGATTTLTDTIVGIGFDPTVRAMVHLYF